MRRILSFALVFLLAMQLAPAARGADNPASQVNGLPPGTKIDVFLKDKQVLRGTKGEVSASGFTLVNPNVGDREISFDDVTTVKQVSNKSHAIRNTLIVMGVLVAVVVVVAATVRFTIGLPS